MFLRLLTGLAAFTLLVAPARADEKKKAPATPETGPAPLAVPANLSYEKFEIPLVPPPRPVEPAVVVSHAVEPVKHPSAHSSGSPAYTGLFWSVVKRISLPFPIYLEGHSPQYFPAEPAFPLLRELANPEEAAGSVKPVKATPVAGRTETRTYSVGDLVVPLPKAGESPKECRKTLEADLIRSITATIEPKSWRTAGGVATIEYFPLGMAIVVNALPHVQAAIESYLDNVRQMNDLQIQVEIVVMSISEAGLEKCGLAKDFLPTGDKGGSIRSRMKFMSPEQMTVFRLCKEEIKNYTRPNLSILNGQEGRVTVGGVSHYLTGVTVQSMNNAIVMVPRNEPHETGVEVKIEGTVSADKRFVQLAVNGRSCELAVQPVAKIPVTVPVPAAGERGKAAEKTPFTQFIEDPKFVTRSVAETVNVPDGGTVILYGGKADFEKTVRESMPMLEDVPVLAGLFSREKKETSSDHLIIIATPRIVNPHAGTEECDAPCCPKADGKLGKLMAEYAAACKGGKAADALKLAVECLAIDPTCFGKR